MNRWVWGWLLTLGFVAPPAAQSQETLEAQVQALQQRLQQAESRLQQLEAAPPDAARLKPAGSNGQEPAKPDEKSETKEAPEANDGDTAERLEELEKAWKDYQAELAEEKADAAKEPTFSLGGRIHLDHWSFTEDDPGIGFFENPDTGVDPEDRIFFRRIRLEAEGNVFDTMLYRFQVDFNTPSEPEYKDVYLGFTELPGNHTVLLGNQKRPLGLDHLNSSRFNVFIERPLVVEAFNEDARRIGIAAYTHTDDLVYNAQYGIYQLENTTDDGEYVGDSMQLSANARLASSPWYDEESDGRGYLHWAVAGMLAHPDGDVSPLDTNLNEGRFRTRSEIRSTSRWLDTGRIPGADWYEILGLESIFNYGPLQIAAEQQVNWLQRDHVSRRTGSDLFFHGGYVYVAYFLTGEHVPLNRESGTIGRVEPFENFFLVERLRGGPGHGWGAWQVALRWSYLDLTDQDVQGGIGQNVALGLNWWWTSHSRLQFNAIRGEIDEHEPVGGFTEGDFWALGTRWAVDF